VGTSQSYAVFYRTDNDPHPEGYGAQEHSVGNLGNSLRAIDYQTGNIVWTHPTSSGAQNLMTTAGGLLFGTDGYGNYIAFDAKTGKALWHQPNAAPGNPGITFMLDGRQHILIASGGNFMSFALPEAGAAK